MILMSSLFQALARAKNGLICHPGFQIGLIKSSRDFPNYTVVQGNQIWRVELLLSPFQSYLMGFPTFIPRLRSMPILVLCRFMAWNYTVLEEQLFERMTCQKFMYLWTS